MMIEKNDREIGEFIQTQEWGKQNMNLEMLREDATLDTEVDDMKKAVRMARSLGASDEHIIDLLIKDYGNDFTKQRIERLVKTGK